MIQVFQGIKRKQIVVGRKYDVRPDVDNPTTI